MDNTEYQKLLTAMDAAEVAWWEMTLPSGEVRFADTKATMLGYKPERFTHYKDFTDLVDPADYEPMMEDMRKHMSGERDIYETMYRIKAADGTWTQFYDRGRIVKRENGSVVIAGFVTNVNNIQRYSFNVTERYKDAL